MAEEVSNLILMKLLKPCWNPWYVFFFASIIIIIVAGCCHFFPHSLPFEIGAHYNLPTFAYGSAIKSTTCYVGEWRSTIQTTSSNKGKEEKKKKKIAVAKPMFLSDYSYWHCYCKIIENRLKLKNVIVLFSHAQILVHEK